MALYTTSSHSVNSTADHHIQPEKRHPSIEDDSFPTKRKRLSITMTEPNVPLNTLLPSSCPLVTSSNESTTISLLEQTETKSHHMINAAATPLVQSESISLAIKPRNTYQLQNTLMVTEHTFNQQQQQQQQQQQKTINSIPPLSSSWQQLPPLSHQEEQDTSDTTEAIESSHPSSILQQDTLGTTEATEKLDQSSTLQEDTLKTTETVESSHSSSIQQHDISETTQVTESSHQSSTQEHDILDTIQVTDQPPPILQQQQQQLGTSEVIGTLHASSTQQHETSKSYSTTQHEKNAICPPPISNNQPQQQNTKVAEYKEDAISVPGPSSTLKETVSPITPQTKQLLPQTTLVEGRSKRIRKPVEYNVKEWETFKQVSASGRGRSTKAMRDSPRWYTQSYMMFLALREHPDHCLSRPDLIRAALAMDEKISKERNLPKVFRSKTPSNSASAILTTNIDRYYISYKPEGSRSRWFRLAYPPGNFDHAYGEYRKWMDKLVNHDWLHCFGVPLENSTPMSQEEIDAIIPGCSTALLTTTDHNHSTTDNDNNIHMECTDTSPSLNDDSSNNNNTNDMHMEGTNTSSPLKDDDINNDIIMNDSNTPSLRKDNNNNNELTEENSHHTTTGMGNSEIEEETSSLSTNTKLDQVKKIHQPMYQLDQLDLSSVPKGWQDIVRVDKSTIPNSGQGLFAVRELPYNTPLGFYFGVPMTEYEFDSIKENVGRASEYSIKYRKTILDATDEHGEPYTLENTDNNEPQRLCPFHYMNEAKDIDMANILFVEGVVVNQVICWSKRNIHPGEELLVWYGTDVNRYWKDDSDQQQQQAPL